MSKIISTLLVIIFVFVFGAAAFADTIHLKDGTTVKGKVVGFKDQQFIVLIGDGSRGGRRSQLQLYIEDVLSIDFDDAGSLVTVVKPAPETRNETAQPRQQSPVTVTSTLPTTPRTGANSGGLSQVINSQPVTSAPRNTESNAARSVQNTSSGKFFSVPVKVLADATANGWTNTGIVVRKGQRIRVSANGRVSLGEGRFATPAGVGSISDAQRLMKTEPTGALIAVIGDDNNEFVFIGSNREFTAQRDGTLFLGINEGNLDDNSGAFDAMVEAEAVGNTAKR